MPSVVLNVQISFGIWGPPELIQAPTLPYGFVPKASAALAQTLQVSSVDCLCSTRDHCPASSKTTHTSPGDRNITSEAKATTTSEVRVRKHSISDTPDLQKAKLDPQNHEMSGSCPSDLVVEPGNPIQTSQDTQADVDIPALLPLPKQLRRSLVLISL